MSELTSASSVLGLSLCGFMYDRSKGELKSPAIFLLTDSKGGHFAVMRPMGTTGTMVQILDPPYAPKIVDIDALVRNKQWTGKVLMRFSYYQSLSWVFITVVAASFIVSSIIFYKVAARRSKTDPKFKSILSNVS